MHCWTIKPVTYVLAVVADQPLEADSTGTGAGHGTFATGGGAGGPYAGGGKRIRYRCSSLSNR